MRRTFARHSPVHHDVSRVRTVKGKHTLALHTLKSTEKTYTGENVDTLLKMVTLLNRFLCFSRKFVDHFLNQAELAWRIHRFVKAWSHEAALSRSFLHNTAKHNCKKVTLRGERKTKLNTTCFSDWESSFFLVYLSPRCHVLQCHYFNPAKTAQDTT